MNNSNNKYVYLVGTDSLGSIAHAYNKQIAKLYNKQRQNRYNIIKVKITDEINHNLHDNDEIIHTVLTDDKNILLTSSEEEFILDTLCNFMDNINHSIPRIITKLNMLECTKEEAKHIKKFIKFLKKLDKIIQKLEDEKYDVDEDTGELNDRYSLLDMTKVVKFGVKHFL